MNTYNPFISVCVFTYNRANYIKETIESILAQSYTNYELVILDDGSTDNTEQVVRSVNSEKIRYFKKEHTNAPDTRNRVLKEARGEFIIWEGDDDLLHPDTLQIYVDTINKFPDVDICYCKLLAFNENNGIIRQFIYKDWYNKKDDLAAFLLIGQPIPDGSSFIRRKIYDEIGGFNIEFNRAQDYEFYSRVFITKKYNIKYVDEYLSKYRIHDKNITLNLSGQINFQYEIKILNNLLTFNDIKIFFPHLDWNNKNYALSEAYYAIGIKYFNYGEFCESMFYLIKSIKLNPDTERLKYVIESFINMGLAYEIKTLIYFVKGIFNEEDKLKDIIDLIDNYNGENK